MTDKVFEKTSWHVCAGKVSRIRTAGADKSWHSCRSRYWELVKILSNIKPLKLLSVSEWGWDDERQCLTGPSDVRDRYLAVSPRDPGRSFRSSNKHLPIELSRQSPLYELVSGN